MEGAILAGKLAAEVVASGKGALGGDVGNGAVGLKEVHSSITDKTARMQQAKEPQGLLPYAQESRAAVCYGGGADLGV